MVHAEANSRHTHHLGRDGEFDSLIEEWVGTMVLDEGTIQLQCGLPYTRHDNLLCMYIQVEHKQQDRPRVYVGEWGGEGDIHLPGHSSPLDTGK